MKKIFSIAALAALLATLTTIGGLRAAHADVADDCMLSAADFASLQAIQTNPALSPSQELSQELALRKQLLGQTLTCATNNANSLQKTLNAFSPTDAASANIQSTLVGKINDTLGFYGIEAAKLNGAGISGTEAIAREIIAWRSANYDPLAGQVNNFILWSQNQNLFQTAKNRVNQTRQIVNFIGTVSGNNNLQANFNAAQAAFNDAASQNQAAEYALAQLQPSDQSLALIQQSLQSLANAYQKFSDLNTLLQTLLPTNS